MATRETYNDSFYGQSDKNIKDILNGKSDEASSRLKKILLKIIKNELTEKQRQIVIMYYFRNMSTLEIARQENITPQAVSALMARAKTRIFRILKYYFD